MAGLLRDVEARTAKSGLELSRQVAETLRRRVTPALSSWGFFGQPLGLRRYDQYTDNTEMPLDCMLACIRT
jgi:hypothetical protein